MTADAHGNFHGKRLIVFGCGYVGSEVAREALQKGMEVTALTRNEAKAVALRSDGIGAVVADLASDRWHGSIPGGADYVLNCVSSGGGGVEGYRRSYLGGMESILAWARSHGKIGTLVYTSSTSVYPQNGGAVVDESADLGGGERPDILVETESRLRLNAGACARWFILRLAGIYGPMRHHLVSQVRVGEIAGVGEHRLNLAHRDDITAAIWSCFSAPVTIADQVFNVTDDAPAPKREVAAWIATQIAVAAPRFTGQPAEGRRAITPDRVISNAKIKNILGWKPRYPDYRAGYRSILAPVP
jgi:nucleoside-diphosphate-sugar epimerase